MAAQEAQLLQQLRAKVDAEKGGVWDKQRSWFDNGCLRRYLVGCQYKVDKARDALKKTATWREEAKPEKIRIEEVTSVVQSGYMYWNGHDVHGHPILYVRSRLHDTTIDRELRIKCIIACFEWGIKLMEEKYSGKPGVEQWIIVVDEAGKTSKNNDFKLLKKMAPLMFQHYVERLYKMFVVNPSSTLSTIVRMASFFIDDRTKSKLRLSKGDADKQPPPQEVSDKDDEENVKEDEQPTPVKAEFDATQFPELVEDIGIPNLESTYGGQRPVPAIAEYVAFASTL